MLKKEKKHREKQKRINYILTQIKENFVIYIFVDLLACWAVGWLKNPKNLRLSASYYGVG
jgi:hypothetical protein